MSAITHIKVAGLRAARRAFAAFGYLVVEMPGPGVLRSVLGAIEAAKIDHVIDVGAFDGEYARSLRASGYCGTITSFEPSPEAWSRLVEEAGADPAWNVRQLALTSVAGPAVLHRYADGHFDSLSRGRPAGGRFARQLTPRDQVAVATARLDELWDDVVSSGDRILVKVDTQGHDLEVLRGLGDRIGEVAVVQCEVAVVPLYDRVAEFADVLEFLSQEGFRLVYTEPVSRGPDGVTAIEFDCLFVNTAVAPFDWSGAPDP